MSRMEEILTAPYDVLPHAGSASTKIAWRAPLLIIALILGTVGRVSYSWNAPLWFDETFSAVIATQPDFTSLLHWCLTELTGPAFYMPLWLWVKIAGSGDFALRLPSLVLSVVAPLVILAKGSPDRNLRYWWAIFAMLWVPIFGLAGEARPYPHMFMLAAVQAILFVQLLKDPTVTRASGWMLVCIALILTHYWAALPCLVQGVAFLGFRRMRAVATWPAALLLLPVFIWARYHLPMVLGITMPADSAYEGMPLSAVANIPAMILGILFNGTVILATVIVSSLVFWRSSRRPGRELTPEQVLAACGIVSIALILLFGFLRPGFAPRYMTPSMPSFLFALALWARWMMTRNAKPVAVVVAMMVSSAAGLVLSILTEPDTDPRHLFNLQRPSAWLAERHPTRLAMFWDGPIGELTPSAHLDEVGGFFLRRAGGPLSVTIVRAGPDKDVNRTVLASAPVGSTILWVANDDLPDARTPRIERYDARFECRDFGGGQLTMTACRPRR